MVLNNKILNKSLVILGMVSMSTGIFFIIHDILVRSNIERFFIEDTVCFVFGLILFVIWIPKSDDQMLRSLRI